MKDNKGFTVIESLLILVIVGMLGGLGWYVWNAHNKSIDSLTNADSANSSVVKYSKKPAAVKDPTADWTAYSSKNGQFSLKYPKSWVQPTNKEACNSDLFDRSLYLGPDSDSVLKCATEYFGQIWIGSVDGDKKSSYDLGTGYENIVKKDVTVNGVTGQRISGVAVAPSGDLPFAPLKGTIEVHYIFYTKGITYSASYTQAPAGNNPSSDVLSDFDLVVTKTLKFSS